MNKKSFVSAFSVFVLLSLASMSGAQVNQPVNLNPGSAAPELALEKILQAPRDARADWANLNGKVIVLEFWATWCAPCIALQPHLNDLVEKFKGRPIQFISITNEDEEKVASFLKRRTLKGWVGLDLDSSAQKAYGAFAIPKTVIIDQKGKIAATLYARNLTEAMLNQLIDGTFAAATPDKNKEPAVTTKEVNAVDADPAQLTLSIKLSKSPFTMVGRSRGKFMAQGADLKSILSALLGTTSTKVYLPTELQDKRYDVNATLLNDKTEAYKPLVVYAVETALGVKVRQATREVDAYLLTAPKELTGSLKPSSSKSLHVSSAKGVLAASYADINALAANIERVLNAPVINETNLQGKFDWDIIFDGTDPNSIIDAIRKEFGLELTPVKRQAEVVLVEVR